MTKYARCNLDGKPISEVDSKALFNFGQWLQMDDRDKQLAIRLDPEWRKWLGITDQMWEAHNDRKKD